MKKIAIRKRDELKDRTAVHALVAHLGEFSSDDLTTFKTDMAQLTGVAYGGVSANY